MTSPTLPIPTPTVFEFKINLVSLPDQITAGEVAAFTWMILGPKRTTKTTNVYYGDQATPGNLTKEILPLNTKYDQYLKEFISGEYTIPLTFVGNHVIDKPGTYYARAYASIDKDNYWSDEHIFTVKSAKHEIKIISYSEKVKLNQNSTFNWQISGPPTTISYTSIVGSKESKSGSLEETVDLTKTPYKELVKEFISGSYQIPLTFVGNAILPEYGTFYIRALAVINSKNIWSEEYTVSVQ